MPLYVEHEVNDLICFHILFLPNSETNKINDFYPVIFHFWNVEVAFSEFCRGFLYFQGWNLLFPWMKMNLFAENKKRKC